ncbi:MAG: CDP-alcohol phosphatidyltransferase family protein [Kiritimatiellae bacterium]|nr:CDP-alcohol phosphatidyltransferase family protein [Kiritimatiellia bacterium]
MARMIKLGFVTALTVVRFPLVLAFAAGAVLYTMRPSVPLFAVTFAMLVTSAVTDLFDGYFARKFSVQTALGAHMDPLMDKFFYLSTLPLLIFVAVQNGNTNHGIFLLIITILFLSRDQWVTFLRSIGAMDDVSGGAHWSGKVRTALNFPLICLIYLGEECPWQFIPPVVVYVFEAIGLAVNLLSAWIYTHRYWPSLKKAAALDQHH